MDIKVGLGINILDLVDPWLDFPIFGDGRGVAGRGQGHDCRTSAIMWGTRASCGAICRSLTCARHTFALREGAGVRSSAPITTVPRKDIGSRKLRNSERFPHLISETGRLSIYGAPPGSAKDLTE